MSVSKNFPAFLLLGVMVHFLLIYFLVNWLQERKCYTIWRYVCIHTHMHTYIDGYSAVTFELVLRFSDFYFLLYSISDENIGIVKIFDFRFLTYLHTLGCIKHDLTIFRKCPSVCMDVSKIFWTLYFKN